MVTQVSSFCQELYGNTQYIICSPCIDMWCNTVTFFYIEQFVVLHTTHKQHTNHTKNNKMTSHPQKSLPRFAEIAPLGMKAVSRASASCVTCLAQNARRWLPTRPLLLCRKRWHLWHRQSLRQNAGQSAPSTPLALS